jgi:electron transfer flavoprotein beta subunit
MSELRISVCIKSVPDPRCPVKERLDPATGLVTRGADAQGIPRVMSPMDRLALDGALRIRDERPARVIVLTMDSPAATEALRQAPGRPRRRRHPGDGPDLGRGSGTPRWQ